MMEFDTDKEVFSWLMKLLKPTFCVYQQLHSFVISIHKCGGTITTRVDTEVMVPNEL